MQIMNELAECVGLWLAEGDSKTIREVTFTNNNIELIFFFHKVISELYSGSNKPKIYVYSPSPRKLFDAIGKIRIKYYQDRRANRTYYIYRLADTIFNEKWRKIVEQTKKCSDFYPEILRCIFAGEGNIKHDLKNGNSRMVRIANKECNAYIEMLLDHFDIKFKYISSHRCYWISASQLEILDRINIAALHSEKEAKFRNMINSVSRKSYSRDESKLKLLSMMNEFHRTRELADKLNIADLEILIILRELKREGKINCIRKDDRNTYWSRIDLVDNFVLGRKRDILKEVDTFKSINDVAKATNIYRKTVSRRLRLLENEGLVENINGMWIRTMAGNKLICGIDESGSGLQRFF